MCVIIQCIVYHFIYFKTENVNLYSRGKLILDFLMLSQHCSVINCYINPYGTLIRSFFLMTIFCGFIFQLKIKFIFILSQIRVL